ncbi:hypothetical protein C8Q77DRAFT_1073429 [Trametes polyzona]|nr:hypothetical protein C8Q77DRAFT_1073429 [Trametes polyzona]
MILRHRHRRHRYRQLVLAGSGDPGAKLPDIALPQFDPGIPGESLRWGPSSSTLNKKLLGYGGPGCKVFDFASLRHDLVWPTAMVQFAIYEHARRSFDYVCTNMTSHTASLPAARLKPRVADDPAQCFWLLATVPDRPPGATLSYDGALLGGVLGCAFPYQYDSLRVIYFRTCASRVPERVSHNCDGSPAEISRG